MPDMPMPGQGAAAGSSPPIAQPQQPTSPQATGPGQVTQPSPNLGSERMALTGIGMLAQQIGRLVPMLPFGSDAHRDISEALNKIAKHASMQNVGVGQEQAQMQKMAAEMRQRQGQMQQMMPQAQQMQPRPPMGAMQQQQAA